MKAWIKYILAVLLYYSGVTILYLRQRCRGRSEAIILAYHCFLPEEDPRRTFLQEGLCVSPEVFDAQLNFIRGKFAVVALDRMLQQIKNGEIAASKSLALTIDDGWRDNYGHAFPILTRHKAPATIFLTSDYIGTDRVYWFVEAHRMLAKITLTKESIEDALIVVGLDDGGPAQKGAELADRLYEAASDPDAFIEILKEFNNDTIYSLLGALTQAAQPSGESEPSERLMLTWEEVSRMGESMVSFGSHGCSHQILVLLDPENVKEEVTRSAEAISEKLGKAVTLFSYPNGDHDKSVRDSVERAGYAAAVATSRGGSTGEIDYYALRRIGIHDGTSVTPSGKFSRAMFALHLARHI